MAKKYDPKLLWEIRVKSHSEAIPIALYQGPWTGEADTQWAKARVYHARRVRRFIPDNHVMGVLYGHPDLVELEVYLDVFYVSPGEREDPPNRTADPDIRAAIRRRVPPFDCPKENFWPVGFDPDAIEESA